MQAAPELITQSCCRQDHTPQKDEGAARRLQREQRRTYVQQPSLRPESALQEFHEEVRERGGEDGEVGLSLWTFGQSLKPLRHWLLC